MSFSLRKKLIAEFLGTAFLLAVVVGSGIMAERLCGGNVGLALLVNSIATGTGLLVLIWMFGPISGAHFNPIVSLSMLMQGEINAKECAAFILLQTLGAFVGVAAANTMFDLPVFFASEHVRTGAGLWWSEIIASFGLIAVIISTSRSRPSVTPAAVAAYITAAYWFTASSSFANPAVTLARAATDTFAGIRLWDVKEYVLAQILGALLATMLFTWLYTKTEAGKT